MQLIAFISNERSADRISIIPVVHSELQSILNQFLLPYLLFQGGTYYQTSRWSLIQKRIYKFWDGVRNIRGHRKLGSA